MGRRDLYVITQLDKQRHEAAVSKLRACLFAHRSLEECFTEKSVEKVLPPRVTVLIDLATGKPDRTLSLGGLEYELFIPNKSERTFISVNHVQADRFWLYAWIGRYTRFALGRSFADLERAFVECVDALALEATQAYERQRK